LPVVDWTDTPADLNGLVRFAERWNLVSVRVPSHFKCGLVLYYIVQKLPWELHLSKIHTKFQDHTLSCTINTSTLEVCIGIVDDRKFVRCKWCMVTCILIQSFMKTRNIIHVFLIGERHLDIVILWICMWLLLRSFD